MKSANSPETLFRIVMWGISLCFASFLVGLGNIIIRDLPKVERAVQLEDYQDAGQLQKNTQRREQNQKEQTVLTRERELAQQSANTARSAYASEQDNYHNWLALRGITEDNKQNPDVVARAQHLETLKVAQRKAQLELERIDGELIRNRQETNRLYEQEREMSNEARKPYESARRRQELSIFGVRLLFTLPLLGIGIWAFRSRRTNKYWPLWRGFIGFALFTFFFELVPYLPSYGGYVRYAVGIILTALAGHYLIKWMQAYLERRKAAEQQAESTRRASMDRDAALRKLSANLCPSCERPVVSVDGKPASFCVHCGLNLYTECGHCHSRMNSFFAHCGACGQAMPRCDKVTEGTQPPRIPPASPILPA